MPTSKVKADNFIRDLQQSERELRDKYGIDRKDVVMNVSVNVLEQVRYSSAEDED